MLFSLSKDCREKSTLEFEIIESLEFSFKKVGSRREEVLVLASGLLLLEVALVNLVCGGFESSVIIRLGRLESVTVRSSELPNQDKICSEFLKGVSNSFLGVSIVDFVGVSIVDFIGVSKSWSLSLPFPLVGVLGKNSNSAENFLGEDCRVGFGSINASEKLV